MYLCDTVVYEQPRAQRVFGASVRAWRVRQGTDSTLGIVCLGNSHGPGYAGSTYGLHKPDGFPPFCAARSLTEAFGLKVYAAPRRLASRPRQYGMGPGSSQPHHKQPSRAPLLAQPSLP